MKTLFITLLSLSFAIHTGFAQKDEHNLSVKKNLEIFNKAYTQLERYYVDTIDSDKHVKQALQYLTQSLDPYTEFYTEEKSHELKEMSSGKYAGIGSPINYDEASQRCVFKYPYPDMPAGKAGLRTGDLILSIDSMDMKLGKDESSRDFLSRVTDNLRGEAGTTFTLRVKRPWVNDSILTLKLTRQIIERPSVVYTHLTADSIGYIHLTSFIESTTSEMKRAFVALKQKGMKKLVLDLRGNGGGLMLQAVNVVGMFMPIGTKVLETKGKMDWANDVNTTSEPPLDTEIPIAVLVNSSSASAAEITAGALQDYDRAVIVGTRTYGKGLVQSTLDLPYNTAMKVTTSKYLIPSGRLIQAYKYNNGVAEYMPDSLAKTFYTRNGRPVKDGGGITPDIKAEGDSIPDIVYSLSNTPITEDFCIRYRNTHDKIAAAKDFRLTDADYEAFCNFLKEKNFQLNNRIHRAFKILKETAHINGEKDIEDSEEWKALYNKLTPNLEAELRKHAADVKEILEVIIIENYYSEAGLEEYSIAKDEMVNKTFDVLRDMEGYEKTLGK